MDLDEANRLAEEFTPDPLDEPVEDSTINAITVTGNTRVPFQAVAWERTDTGLVATGWWGRAIGNGEPMTVEFIGDMTIEYHSDEVTR